MRTEKLLFIITFLFCFHLINAQNLDRLTENNGFREIKLGSHIKDYPAFIKKNTSNKEYFGAVGSDYDYIFDHKVDGTYDKIGDAEIYAIFVKTYRGKIFKINITLEKEYGIVNLLKYSFGKPSFENIEIGMIRWTTENNIECKFLVL